MATGAEPRPEEEINEYLKAQAGAGKIANGLGVVVLSWSSVVLLGGFVSVLRVKDFWFITVLTFIVASKFLTFANTKTGGIYEAEINIIRLHMQQYQLVKAKLKCWMNIFLLSVVVIAKSIFVCCAVVFFGFYPYFCLGVSVTRLVQRDYGDAGGDVASKIKLHAALDIFYVLVILHTLSVWYVAYLNIIASRKSELALSKRCGFGDWGPLLVWGRYRTETRAKCNKDPLLLDDWNLITFGVGLLESTSLDDCLSGARVLDTFIEKGIPVRQEVLSSGQCIENLMSMIDLGHPRSTTADIETRERAARIVGHLASSSFHIAQFPGVLQCICTLLDSSKQKYSDPAETSENSEDQRPKKKTWNGIMMSIYEKQKKPYNTRKRLSAQKDRYTYAWKGTKCLISQGLVILERLTQDQDNCMEILNHQRLLSKFTSPMRNHDLLLSMNWFNDHALVEMLSRSLTVVSRIITSPGDAATSLRHELLHNPVAVGNLMGILEADSVGARELHGQALKILMEIVLQEDSFTKVATYESTSMMERLVNALRRIFLEEDNGSNTIIPEQDMEKSNSRLMRKAGEALARLLVIPSETNCINVVGLLSKQDVINLLTKALYQISSIKIETVADAGALYSSPVQNDVESDVESQPPKEAGSTQRPPIQENEEQSEERKLMAAMLYLAVVICNKNVVDIDDFPCAIPKDAKLVKNLKEIVEINKEITTDCLGIAKLTCQLVIAIIQLKPNCIADFSEHDFMGVMSKVLESMSNLDDCMQFAGKDREVTMPARSLASLVKEADELFNKAQEQVNTSA